MQVRKIDTSRARDVRQFIRFPFDLYKDCEQWVPPLLPEMRLALNRRKYPFYRNSEADFFVVESEGQTLGRIVAIDNRPYNAYHGTRVAFFYYLDIVNDLQVSRLLFDAAFEWARARGLDTMYGPNGLLRYDGHGLLVEGFEHRPSLGLAYNYAYYGDLVEDAGFEKSHDYLSGHVSKGYDLPQRFYEIAEKVQARRGYQVRSFKRTGELLALAPALHRIYEEAFVQVWGYYPVEQEEIEALIRRIATIADPRLIKIVLKDEEPVGFVIAYPDVSAAVQRTKGRLWPFGWIQILRERTRTEWVTFNGVGVLPKYQGMGANAVLYAELAKTFMANDFQFLHGDYVQVAETNLESLGDAIALQMEWFKRHRVYRRAP
jgi:L-amino acid N-acyltransferase YncA